MSSPETGNEPAFADYVAVLRSNWSFIAVLTGVVSALALGLSLVQEDVYRATVDVVIARPAARQDLLSQSPPDIGTELILARRSAVQQAARARLGHDPEVTVHRVGDTAVIRITAEANSEGQAARIAAAYGDALVETRTEQAVSSLEAVRRELEEDRAQLGGSPAGAALGAAPMEEVAALAEAVRTAARQRDAADLRSAIAALERTLGTPPPAAAERLIRISALELLIDEIAAAEALVRNTPAEVVSPPKVSDGAIRPAPLRNTVVAALLGLMFGTGGVLARWYVDRRVTDARSVISATGLPVLAALSGAPGRRRGHGSVGSSTALDLQELRSALQLRGAGERIRALQLTSPQRVGGLVEFGAAVCEAFVRTGLTVVVVDADPRGSASRATAEGEAIDVERFISSAPRSGCRRVISGATPEDPAAYLGSERFREEIAQLLERADLVLVAAPPVLGSSDPLLIARVVDTTVLVASPGTTRMSDAAEAVERFRELGNDVLGVVVASLPANRTPSAPRVRTTSPPPTGGADGQNGHSGGSPASDSHRDWSSNRG